MTSLPYHPREDELNPIDVTQEQLISQYTKALDHLYGLEKYQSFIPRKEDLFCYIDKVFMNVTTNDGWEASWTLAAKWIHGRYLYLHCSYDDTDWHQSGTLCSVSSFDELWNRRMSESDRDYVRRIHGFQAFEFQQRLERETRRSELIQHYRETYHCICFDGITQFTVAQLKDIAKTKGVKGTSKYKKSDWYCAIQTKCHDSHPDLFTLLS